MEKGFTIASCEYDTISDLQFDEATNMYTVVASNGTIYRMTSTTMTPQQFEH